VGLKIDGAHCLSERKPALHLKKYLALIYSNSAGESGHSESLPSIGSSGVALTASGIKWIFHSTLKRSKAST
jgi:hypothetical protein